jgi:hypothetical protein
MIFLDTFLLNKGGLFDFDLTFVAEVVEFVFLSFIVTFCFIAPISKQLDERAEFINTNLRKSLLLVTYGYEKLTICIDLLTSEISEMTRQVKLVKSYSNENFENEILFVQKENGKLLSKLKGDLSIKSAYLFSNIVKDLVKLSNTFYSKKFKI